MLSITRVYLTFISLYFAGTCLAALPDPSAAPSTLRIGSTHYPPFVICDKNNTAIDGIDVRILMAAAARTDIKVNVVCTPWRRALHEAASGNLDGVFPAFFTQQRASWGDNIPTPLHHESYALFVQTKKAITVNKLEDLFGKRLGIQAGFHVSEKFEQALAQQNFTLQGFKSAKHGLKALQRDRIDIYLGDITTTGFIATQMGLGDALDVLPKRLTKPEKTHLILSKKSSNAQLLKAKVSQSIEQLKYSGELKKITDKYMREFKINDRYCPQHVDVLTID